MLLLPLFYLLPSVFVGIHTQQSGAQENPQQYSKSFFFHFLSYAPLSLRIPDGPRVERLFKLEIIGP